MVKGNQKETKRFYVGLANVKIVAINPNRSELNKLLGREDKDEDKEIDYLSEYEDKKRVRINIWLRDQTNDNLYTHSFNILDEERLNKTGDKYQYINSTCTTTWTDDEDNLPSWFVKFEDYQTKEVLGDKKYRKALQGEDELVTIVRSWLGKLNWNHPDTEVEIDTKKLFSGNFKELQSQVDGDYDTSFTVLLGVKTVQPKEGEEGEVKQYQSVYTKTILPSSFMKFINNNFTFPNERTGKIWNKFKEEISGDYGPDFYYELEVVSDYNKEKDLAASSLKKVEIVDEDSTY